MERNEIKNILETLFFITDEPVSIDTLSEVFDNEVTEETFVELIEEIKNDYSSRVSPIELRQIAEGYQFATKPDYAQWVRKLFKERVTLRLSQSAVESLAIIAYKQPITRAEIEEIRGVETISVLETLLERKLIRIVGRKETVGRPLLYGTTNEFLKYFGLVALSDLPSLEEFIPPEQETAQPSAEQNPEENPETDEGEDITGNE